MSALHQKLERLKEKQAQVERQLAAQAAAENSVITKAFALILEASTGAYKSAQTSIALDSLSTRERATFDSWLSRIEPPSHSQSPESTQTNQFGSTNTQTDLPE